jgi:hypothetical protein
MLTTAIIGSSVAATFIALLVIKVRAPNSVYAKLLDIPGKWLYAHVQNFDWQLDERLGDRFNVSRRQARVPAKETYLQDFSSRFWKDDFKPAKPQLQELAKSCSLTPP